MQTHTLARLWVTAQFGLLALMFGWPAPHWRLSWPALALLAAGAVLVLWVFWHNRPGNFNIVPEPRQGAHLVTTGPYRWMRHPMYVALILFMAGVATAAHSPVQWALWIALGVVLNFKAAMEERLLSGVWPDYAGYARVTRRFIPGLW
ncbi:MAG: isoprenylcysteine carboxylmethyltransferase family protein [Thiomonas sp.]|jgi:protein-S-isoprenylcysteine O-methyltransferase Ste14|uniref:methyltransferase family protein n=1 Tax=Thiomonas TaxID=32012 RepID=UPI000BD23C80|nr:MULTISPECIES: isoprenylcysteine carboxylmethyltransferase family protein [Thiomonas]MDE1977704.1 isoprenylcysteine carboxylmethyltransferase family protein [Betaproteobacteria bacterium]OYV28535.1 MAG: isoprenylcysteine carboxyl methyltransferase [Thiomonas sp. 20-64-9]MDE2270257.1 isoprenylcysteine carboxylmethyltransferase family protein [Betaproteobacteria bacterium]OZB69110.1 MAG: isoprenylcysteine carboxyl methyltransferase [Thiomonas sp. 13-64-67]HML82307.1 isoprenylcysteine carboxylm